MSKIKRIIRDTNYDIRTSRTLLGKVWNTVNWKCEFMSLRIWIKRAEKANDHDWFGDLMETGREMSSEYLWDKNQGYTW